MKNMMKLIVAVAFVWVATGVSAQQVKLGHIESQKLIQAMPEMAAAQKTLQNKQSEVEKELTTMKEQFPSSVKFKQFGNLVAAQTVASFNRKRGCEFGQRRDGFFGLSSVDGDSQSVYIHFATVEY